tara:strand:+ start:238 stop:489 length:252 start_codon:yes stop_codon:yes gene_type:complete
MDLTTRKNKFKERFDGIMDSNLVERFEEFLDIHLSKTKIVAYTVQGEPLTKEMYIERVKKSDADMDAGRFVTSDELEKKIRLL